MIWSFARGDEAIRLETRFDNQTREYVLEITWADRSPTIETFKSLAQFRARVVLVEDQLSAEHWVQVGGPEILPHGWRGPTSH
jgi:hypothetical protein